jgi:branched-chain amino acid transport system substrate-binding protein
MRKYLMVVLLLMGLLLTACPAGQPETPAPAEPPPPDMVEEPAEPPAEPPAEEPAEEPVGDFQCDDEIGCVEIPEGEPIVLAYMLVISGENESLGVDSRNGAELAVEERGEIMGHEIELVGEDEGCSPEGGQTAATRVTANPEIVAVIGTSCSSAARVAIPLVTDAGMVMVSPSNTAPGLTAEDRGPEYDGYLRTAHNDLFQGRVAAEFAYNELGLRRAATIHDGSPYADSLQQVFADVFEELGGEVVAQEAINVGDTDMRPVLTRIATGDPDIIYYPIFVAEAGFVTSQAAEVSGLEDVVLMGADAAFSDSFVAAAGQAAAGMYISGPYVGEGAGYDEFVQAHQARFGTGPISGFHAHAYDAANMIMDAIEQVAVQGQGGTLFIPRQALRDALYNTQGFQGLTGTLSCNEYGDCATGEALAIFQVGDDAAWPPPVVYQP